MHKKLCVIFSVLHTFGSCKQVQCCSSLVCPLWFSMTIVSRLSVKKTSKEEMDRDVPDKMLLLQKIKKCSHKESTRPKKKKDNKILIMVTVLGSAGPIRFMVNEDDPVSRVINATLKSYAQEGRLPVLGFNTAHFFLYCRTDFRGIHKSAFTHQSID